MKWFWWFFENFISSCLVLLKFKIFLMIKNYFFSKKKHNSTSVRHKSASFFLLFSRKMSSLAVKEEREKESQLLLQEGASCKAIDFLPLKTQPLQCLHSTSPLWQHWSTMLSSLGSAARAAAATVGRAKAVKVREKRRRPPYAPLGGHMSCHVTARVVCGKRSAKDSLLWLCPCKR